MTEESKETRSEKQIPLFDGSKEQWPFYKERLESTLVKYGLAQLLYYDGDIVPDNYVFTDEEKKDKEAVKLMKELRGMNVKAAGILLDSIQTKTMDGKIAFNTVKRSRTRMRDLSVETSRKHGLPSPNCMKTRRSFPSLRSRGCTTPS